MNKLRENVYVLDQTYGNSGGALLSSSVDMLCDVECLKGYLWYGLGHCENYMSVAVSFRLITLKVTCHISLILHCTTLEQVTLKNADNPDGGCTVHC